MVGNCGRLIDVLYRHFPEETEEKYGKSQSTKILLGSGEFGS
jgi:hypothetical protein